MRFSGYQLDIEKRILLKQGEPVELSARAFDILLVLLENAGKTISKGYLVKAVWHDAHVAESIVAVYITGLRKTLGDSKKNPKYILTIPGEGYRFIEKVEGVSAQSPAPARPPTFFSELTPTVEPRPSALTPPNETDDRLSKKGRDIGVQVTTPIKVLGRGKVGFALVSSFIYALLYSLSLLAEVAYQFNEYGSAGIRLSIIVFFFIFFSSLFALYADWKRVIQGKSDGLLIACSIFLFSAMGLAWGLWDFLPAHPVTEVQSPNLTSQTAQAAYLKDITYHLVVVLGFLAIPFHFILACLTEIQKGDHRRISNLFSSTEKSVPPHGTLYLRVWFLIGLLLLFVSYSLYAHPNLLDKLAQGPYMNLFMILIQVRLFLFYALIVCCIVWYYTTLNEVKRLCLAEGEEYKNNFEQSKSVTSTTSQSFSSVATVNSLRNPTIKLWQHPLLVLVAVSLPVLIFMKVMFAAKPKLQINRVVLLSPAIHKQEFFIRLEGGGISPNIVQAILIGPHCPRFDNCVVPNNVMEGVSRTTIARMPLTLDAGQFNIYLRNGNDGELSQGYTIEVENNSK